MTRPIVIVAGVSGVGKSTVGRRLAARAGAVFVDGDDFHSPENIAKLRSGAPLDEADRRPWLAAIGRRIDDWRAEGTAGVLACSALRRSYRDDLRRGRREVAIVLLTAPLDVLERRLAARRGHFMPASLLPSQLATLEPPSADEANTFEVNASGAVDDTVTAILARLAVSGTGGCPA